MKLSPEAGRESAMDAGLRQAINVPLNLAKHVDTVWDTLVQMAAVGNINCKSDLQVFFFYLTKERSESMTSLRLETGCVMTRPVMDGLLILFFFRWRPGA